MSLKQIDMVQLVRTSVAEARAIYSNRKPRSRSGELPPAAADPGVIRHVWSNLIGNAFKYSSKREEPSIRISGRVEGEQTIYTVEDNGAGFDMQYAEKLFGVFKRLHSARDFQGTGVGLAIAHRILMRHGGWIRARAEPDKGATFEFALPAHVPTDLRAAAGLSNN